MTPAQREERMQKMERAVRLAYLAYYSAEQRAGRRLTYKEAHTQLTEEGMAGEEWTDYKLPRPDTFARYVSEALKQMGEPKNTRRQERPLGRSVVR